MKVRHILIIITTLLIMVTMVILFVIGRKTGIAYGVEHAEEIRSADRIKSNTDSTLLDNKKRVKTTVVKNETYPVVLEGYGRVNASTIVSISSEVQGKLQSFVELKKGTKFTKGTVLFKVDDTDFQIALQSKKSNFLTLLTGILPDLKIDYPKQFDKWLKFYNQIKLTAPLPAFPEFETPKEKSFIISRNILSQYYNIKSDEERLSKYVIKAPFNGSIIETFADDGAIVAPGMQVVKVLRDGKKEIEIPVLSQNIELVKKGTEVYLKHNTNDTIKGKIVRIGTYINAVTQTLPVFVEIEDSREPLYNGMYLESEIHTNSVETGIKLPRTALFADNMVYVVDKENKLRKRKVTVITRQDEDVLVKGLKNGERVVVEAVVNVEEGESVEF